MTGAGRGVQPEWLAAVPLFAGLDDAALATLATSAFPRRLARGQLLFSEGEPSEHLFVVQSGRLRVFASSPRGDELVLSLIGPGESLGELSVLDGRPRSASVEAIEASVLLALPAAVIRTLLHTDHAALLAVTLELAAGMRRLTGHAADLVFLDLPRRLARLLIQLSATSSDGRTTVNLAMSQSGVAAQLGVARQSLNRALGGLVKRGWIELDGSAVTVRDVEALRRFADS